MRTFSLRVLCLAMSLLPIACSSSAKVAATPGTNGFDGDLAGWRADSTGGTGPNATWGTKADKAAISAPNVMAMQAANHDSEERFNLFWTDRTRFHDGRLTLAVRADDGTLDQGGGPIWRAQDANNYYVCRFNPLESNYRVYVVKDGVRRQLGTALVEAKAKKWHRVAVEHHGEQITCWLDGQKLLEVTDATIPTEGGVGLWTKADARTSFDDLVVTPAK